MKSKVAKTLTNPNDVFTILRNGMQNFSAQQSSLCSYILNNYHKVAFYTVEELSQKSGISPATIVRTTKSLGYKNYKDFLSKIQDTLMIDNRSVWWELQKIWDSKDNNTNEPILSWVAKDDIEAVTNTVTEQLILSIEQAVKLLSGARKIGVIGMRSSKYVSGFMHYMLNQLFQNSYSLPSNGYDTVYDDLLNFNKEDVLTIISLGGPHFVSLTHEIAAFAKENNIPTILITSDRSNPCIDNVTLPLFVESTKQHYSIIQPLVLVETLITELGRVKENTARQKLQKLEPLLQEKKITL